MVTPKVREQLAKGKDAKAVATLTALRTASELYYIENEKKSTVATIINRIQKLLFLSIYTDERRLSFLPPFLTLLTTFLTNML